MTATYTDKKFVDQVEDYAFPVYTTEVKTENGLVIPDRTAIVRGDTDQVVGLVGSTYEVLTHEQALNPILEALSHHGSNVRRQVRLTHNGARMYARLFMQDMEQRFGHNEKLWPGFTVVNSLDGTRKYHAEMTLMRLVCTNGMRVPMAVASFSTHHTKNAQFGDAIGKILDFLNNPASFEFIAQWNQQAGPPKRDEEEIIKAIEAVCDTKGCKFPKRYKEDVADYYVNAENGFTVWNFFNAFNSVIEHNIAGEKNKLERARELDENVFNTFAKVYAN